MASYIAKIKDSHIYFSPNIPPGKLRNATTKYAHLTEGEQPLVLIDNTAFGGAKDGALLTDVRFYAHNTVESPQSFELADIEAVLFAESLVSKLYINDMKFLEINFPEGPGMQGFARMLREIIKVFRPDRSDASPVMQKLKELKEMCDAGIITKEEFDSKKQEILAQM